jgi:multicomponent K+:H+ antiporter subunit F
VILGTVLPWLAAAFTLALLLATWRLIKGPGLPDRILALDTLYVNACALLVLLGIYFSTALFFEAALLIALLGFIGTVVLSKFMIRGDIVE